MKFSYARFIAIIAAAISVLFGILVSVGWVLHNLFLIQLQPQFPPAQLNTAICFILAGLSVGGITLKVRKLLYFALPLLFVIAGATLLEYLFSLNLGIDELLIKAYVTTSKFYSGRMAPDTAAAFFLISVAIWLLSIEYSVAKVFLSLVLAFTAMLISAIGLIGYLSTLTTQYGIGQNIRMAPHTAAILFILTSGIIATVFLEKKREDYLPAIGVGVTYFLLLITLLGWESVKKSQDEYLLNLVRIKAENIQSTIKLYMQERITAFDRITKRWVAQGGTPESVWRSDIKNYIKDQPGYQAIEWEDSSYRIRWVEPEIGNEKVLGLNLYQETRRRTLMQRQAFEKREIQMSDLINLVQGGKGVLLFSPIFFGNDFQGFMVGVLNVQQMLNHVLPSLIDESYNLEIYDDESLLYSSEKNDKRFYNDWSRHINIVISGQTWTITVWPTHELYSEITSSPFSVFILIVGTLFACLSGVVVSVLQVVHYKSKALNQAKQELSQSYGRLNGIIEGSRDIVVAIDKEFNLIIFNNVFRNEIKRIFNIDIKVGDNYEKIAACMTADLKEDLIKAWQDTLEGNVFVKTTTFVAKDFSETTYEIHHSPIYDLQGNIIGASRISANITERLNNEKRMIEIQEELQNTVKILTRQNKDLGSLKELMNLLQASNSLEAMAEPIKIFTKRILNETSGEIYIRNNKNQNEIIHFLSWGEPQCPQKIIKKSDCWGMMRGKMHVVKGDDLGVTCLHVSSSRVMPEACVCVPLFAKNEMSGLMYVEMTKKSAANKRFLYLIQILAEQIALSLNTASLYETLQYQSIHDALTGLHNRRFFEDYLQKALYKAQRYQEKFYLLMIDIDYFKDINDQFGHLIGDRVIQAVAKELGNHCRKSDLLCRWGGEEFLLFFHEGSIDTVRKRADAMCKAIAGSLHDEEGNVLPKASVSIGVSNYPNNGDSLNSLTAAADKALYTAKQNGRNQIVIHT